ncbi:hypothetical protein [Peribacillus sp. SCS-155]|uniref:hypothetical protein n=1 Tax=Peribacillus sedimenti TaxID=3115297 RepID=UPI0039066C66
MKSPKNANNLRNQSQQRATEFDLLDNFGASGQPRIKDDTGVGPETQTRNGEALTNMPDHL